ncbi:MAG: site-2 protease family protein [Symploca sp. SIO2B6]|nr:site-2 protease family protein [Symploca sp. SIO2B6]
MITLLLLMGALSILGLGLYRSLPYGRLGIFSWLQAFVVMLPWLIFFGLSAMGVILNLVAVLALIVIATGTYIVLGKQIRTLAEAQEESPQEARQEVQQEARQEIQQECDRPNSTSAEPVSPDSSPFSQPDSLQSSQSDPLFSPSGSSSPQEDGDSHSKAIPSEDIQKISTIFGIDTFFSIEQNPYYNGMLFKGNLRGEPTAVYDVLSSRLDALFGSKYRLFLMEEPNGKPIVVVFPTANDPSPATRMQWVTAGCLFVVTLLTCMVASATFQGFDLVQTWSRWPETLLLTGSITTVLVGHEVGHWLMARRYDIRLGPPFFLPTWQIGSFGALTRIESVLPHRTALFDIAFAGPAVGGCLAFVFLGVGLLLSHPGSLFQLSPTFFHSSVLVGTLARVFLGSRLQQDIVDIHPFVIVGWLGLLITAINVMPVGQLDGGRIVQAIYGRKIIRRTSIVTLVVLAIATLFSPLALYWMVVILFLQRQLEQPQQNELTEPDDTRAALGLLALFLMAAMLLPLSPELASRLGIGG